MHDWQIIHREKRKGVEGLKSPYMALSRRCLFGAQHGKEADRSCHNACREGAIDSSGKAHKKSRLPNRQPGFNIDLLYSAKIYPHLMLITQLQEPLLLLWALLPREPQQGLRRELPLLPEQLQEHSLQRPLRGLPPLHLCRNEQLPHSHLRV